MTQPVSLAFYLHHPSSLENDTYITPAAWKVHHNGVGQGVYHAPKIPLNAGRDLNALSNDLADQNKDPINAGPKFSHKENGVAKPVNGATNPPDATNGAQPVANVPVPANGGPTQNGQQAPVQNQTPVQNYQPVPVQDQAPVQNGQQTPVQNSQQDPNLLHKIAQVPGQAIGTAHDVTHNVVGQLPGGQQAQHLTHGLANTFIPGHHGNDANAQQQQHGGLPNPLNLGKQLPGGGILNH